jgi:hypothetical protein
MQVVGIAVLDAADHMVTADTSGVFYCWSLPGLEQLQRFTRSVKSPLSGAALTSLLVLPAESDRPTMVSTYSISIIYEAYT